MDELNTLWKTFFVEDYCVTKTVFLKWGCEMSVYGHCFL